MTYKSVLGNKIELTPERKKHILLYHPDLIPYFNNIKSVLLKPDDLRISKNDPYVLLFYKFFANIMDGKYIAVVVKINKRSFILTSHFTSRILSGEKYDKE